MKIYAEWENNGVFDNGLFNSWDEYYAAFFNPDIELLCVRVINQEGGKMRVKTVYVKDKQRLKLSAFPNFSVTGSITGIKKIYGKDALLVRCGSWIYNVTSRPDIYYSEAH